jgi:hypothetical protein
LFASPPFLFAEEDVKVLKKIIKKRKVSATTAA